MIWYDVLYNNIETNIQITECGKVRRVKKDWYGHSKNVSNISFGEVDFSRLKLSTKGYRQLKIQIKGVKQKTVRVHQLVASVFYNYIFNNSDNLVVDHKDNDKLNNHKSNIRVISNRENVSKQIVISKGLPIGSYFDKSMKKYRSQIIINKVKIHLGYFDTLKESQDAYKEALYKFELK